MRGNEPYKYEWGAVDEPIERLLVQRTAPAEGTAGDGTGATAGTTAAGGR
jgi:hypothetical protein